MATQITERPHTFNFSENEIRYVFNVNDPAAAGCAVQVELVYFKEGIAAAQKIISFALTPDADGTVYCHVQNYLKSFLKPQLPDVVADYASAITTQVKRFYIKYRQVTNASANTEWIDDSANTKTVLLGGVERMKFKRNNFFVSYLFDTKAWLTWQPKGSFVYINQPHYLTLLIADETVKEFTVRVRTVFTDGTIDNTSEATFKTSVDTPLWRIDASVKKWELDTFNTSKNIYYYEINAISGNIILALPHRFYIQYNPVYAYWDFNYFNSLGGMDFVRVAGETLISADVNSEDVEHIIYRDALNTDKPQEQYTATNFVKKDVYKGDAGFMQTTRQQEALLELLLSRGIYELTDGRWIKIMNLKKSADLRNTTDKKWSFAIEWSYGYDDSVFTPKAILLGNGQADAIPVTVCAPVELPANIVMPDGEVGTPYNFYINVAGDAPYVLAELIKPSWMSVQLVANVLNFTGKPDVTGTNLDVSFTLSNCSGANALPFTDYINITQAVQPNMPEIIAGSNTFSGGIRTQVFTVGPNVNPGNRFVLTVYNHSVIVTAVAGDTPNIIAAKLAQAINNTTAVQWNDAKFAPASGTPGFKPTATSSGNAITASLNEGSLFRSGAYVS